ncbi:MAG: methionine--tRNA ligase [Calditrichaeota bacterium]|nr:MAG: methionine--tRNA ligase [Calditrichota bacterium]
MKKYKRTLVTSALPYANGPLHVGHVAGAYLPADIYVRYCRLKKREVVYICGSDENGVPIMLRARAEGVGPQKIVDRYHTMIKDSFEKLGVIFDYYGRTSSKVHRETSREFFRELDAKKQFITKSDEQLYDPEAQLFLADRFVFGECPNCGYDHAYGDQCEKCGSSLSPDDLINPKSSITNATPIKKKTTHWYLPLKKIQPKLETWINSHQDWRPNVLGQVKSWLDAGLHDRAVTRDLPWGVSVPEEIAGKAEVDASGKVLYVWFDAPIGYISATKEWSQQQGDPERWKKYWQDEDTRLIHFIGKDNIVFHCLIFPAMLMQHGDYVLPENVPANEFLNLEGQKLSTSRNYAVWLHEYLEKFDPDSLRYALASNMPETKDADFSWAEFQARHNNELADILGNFVNRTFTFIHKYFDGKLPAIGQLDALDEELINRISQSADKIGAAIDAFQFKEATRLFMDLARFANKYFNDKAPWKSRKEDITACATALHLCAKMTYALGILMQPILPFTARKIQQLLKIDENSMQDWDNASTFFLQPGHQFNQPEIIFAKIEDEKIQAEIDRLNAATSADDPEIEDAPEAPIAIDDFAKVNLRIADVVAAEPMKGAKKLLKLQVQIGNEKRQVIAGIAHHYEAEELVGKQVVVVANLKPAKLRGEMSEGMILAAVDNDGNLSLVSPEKAMPTGTTVR